MILIENEIVFVSIPKCASISVHFALEKTNLKIEPTFRTEHYDVGNGLNVPDFINGDSFSKIKKHGHQSIAQIYRFLNYKVDTIAIKRDYFKRFLSSFYYVIGWWIPMVYKMDYIPNKITNDFIYKYFTDEVISMIMQSCYDNSRSFEFHSKMKELLIKPLIQNFIVGYDNENTKSKLELMLSNDSTYISYEILASQECWKSGYKPTYEFNIHELFKLEDFIFERYGQKLNIGQNNETNYKNIPINIFEDQKLKDWVWNKFEKQYHIKKIF